MNYKVKFIVSQKFHQEQQSPKSIAHFRKLHTDNWIILVLAVSSNTAVAVLRAWNFEW